MPGEIADMMLEGVLCEGCGEYIGEGDGIPGYCSEQCARDRGADWWIKTGAMVNSEIKSQPRPEKPYQCASGCKRRFLTKEARRDHARDKHGVTGSVTKTDNQGSLV